MYFLINCNQPIYNVILFPLKNIMVLLMIISPILLIISLLMIFIKGLNNPEDKKLPSKIKNAVSALIAIFFVSCITNASMKIFGSTTDISSCWNDSEEVENSTTYYKITGDKKEISTDKDKYN